MTPTSIVNPWYKWGFWILALVLGLVLVFAGWQNRAYFVPPEVGEKPVPDAGKVQNGSPGVTDQLKSN